MKYKTLVLLWPLCALSQQDSGFRQFVQLWQLFTPAYVGKTEDADIRTRNTDYGRRNEHQYANAALLGRSQWTGSKGAPLSEGLTFSYPISRYNLVLGLSAQNVKLGISNLTNAKANLSYRIMLNKSVRSFLSFGMYFGAIQYVVNGSDLVLKDDIAQDPSFYAYRKTLRMPDMGLGIAYKHENFRIGLGIPHLLQPKLKFNDRTSKDSRSIYAKIFQHYYLIASYAIQPRRHLSIEPSALIKYVDQAPLQVDLNTNWVFHKRYWIGATYSSGNALAAGAGILLYPGKDKVKHEIIKIGYTYDLNISGYAKGKNSHEIMVSVSFRTKNDEHYNEK
jgi:type IX secretion system PorP/SprF family membrane protein